MKNIVICLVCLFFSGILIAQDSEVIMTIENEDVSLSDFESIFRKNNKDTLITTDDLDEYMELFINFKLKVQEAKSLGMDTVSSFTQRARRISQATCSSLSDRLRNARQTD